MIEPRATLRLQFHAGFTLDDALPAVAGVDGHDEYEVDPAQELAQGLGGRRGVEGDAGELAGLVGLLDEAVRVGRGLPVEGHDARLRVEVLVDALVGVVDHEVHVERHLRGGGDGAHVDGAERDRRDEVAVHHVDVQVVGVRHALQLAAEVHAVSCEQRGGHHRPRLPSVRCLHEMRSLHDAPPGGRPHGAALAAGALL